MRYDVSDWIVSTERTDQRSKRFVLRVRIGNGFGSFQLYSNREIVAAPSPGVLRFAGVPGTFAAGHKLHNFPGPPDKKMRRYSKPPQTLEIRVGRAIQRVGKQPEDRIPAKFTRWKTDGMDD